MSQTAVQQQHVITGTGAASVPAGAMRSSQPVATMLSGRGTAGGEDAMAARKNEASVVPIAPVRNTLHSHVICQTNSQTRSRPRALYCSADDGAECVDGSHPVVRGEHSKPSEQLPQLEHCKHRNSTRHRCWPGHVRHWSNRRQEGTDAAHSHHLCAFAHSDSRLDAMKSRLSTRMLPPL